MSSVKTALRERQRNQRQLKRVERKEKEREGRVDSQQEAFTAIGEIFVHVFGYHGVVSWSHKPLLQYVIMCCHCQLICHYIPTYANSKVHYRNSEFIRSHNET